MSTGIYSRSGQYITKQDVRRDVDPALIAIEAELDSGEAGAYRTVANIIERDAIPAEQRSAGMLVWVEATTTEYRLGAGLGNGDWVAQGGGGGGLPAVSNIQFAVLLEDPAGVPVFKRLTEDMILPAFAITSYSKTAPNGGTSLYRRGDTLTGLTASASYTSVPTSASIANTLGGSSGGGDIAPPGTWGTFVSPFTSATMGGSVKRDGANGGANPTMTATLTAVGATSPTSAFVLTWGLDRYYGVGAAGVVTEGGIKGLATESLGASRNITFNVAPSNQKVYFALPQGYGTPTFTDTGTGFAVSFTNTTTVGTWTNSNSIVNTYDIYESVQLLTSGSLNISVT